MTSETLSHELEDYSFDYPEDLIAAEAAEPRDSARLLVLDRSSGKIEHARFGDLPRFLEPGDCLVLNSSKVLPARLIARKPTGGKAELLLLGEFEPGVWSALASKLKIGLSLILPDGITAQVLSLSENGEWTLRFSTTEVSALMQAHGLAPLPPYIGKKRAAQSRDRQRYQTVYAKEEGSIAAPTAGLHFTPELLERLRASGVEIAEVTLHVGRGTFRPVSAQDVREHAMLPERFWISSEDVRRVRAAQGRGARVIAVGTTATRTLETWAASGKTSGETGLFIYPGHEFRAVNTLITNFHLPRSTPLLLASALAGREKLLSAYREAIARRYRLFSYGDSMLIL